VVEAAVSDKKYSQPAVNPCVCRLLLDFTNFTTLK
jgi:hypothetical protein